MGVFEMNPMTIRMKYFSFLPAPHTAVGPLAQAFTSPNACALLF